MVAKIFCLFSAAAQALGLRGSFLAGYPSIGLNLNQFLLNLGRSGIGSKGSKLREPHVLKQQVKLALAAFEIKLPCL